MERNNIVVVFSLVVAVQSFGSAFSKGFAFSSEPNRSARSAGAGRSSPYLGRSLKNRPILNSTCLSLPVTADRSGTALRSSLKYVVFPIDDEILYNHIKLLIGREGVARSLEQILGFIKRQLQRDGKGENSTLTRCVVFCPS